MNIFHHDIVDSTNEVARRMVRDQKMRDRAVVVAREQTAGRGTRGRAWASPRDAGVYMTVIDIARPAPWPRMAQCTRAAGVACAEVLRAATGLEIGLKPINDLILHNAKLGGILVEVIAVGDDAAILTGVGVNVRGVPRSVLESALPAIALEEAMDPVLWKRLDCDALIQSLSARIWDWNEIVAMSDLASLEFAWQLYARDWNT